MSLPLDATTIQFGSQLKQGKKPKTPLPPPIRKNTIPPGPWAKSDTEKVELFANHLAEVFTPHDNLPDPEVEREIASYNQPTVKIQIFTLRELTLVSKKVTPTQGTRVRLYHSPNATGIAPRRISNSSVHF